MHLFSLSTFWKTAHLIATFQFEKYAHMQLDNRKPVIKPIQSSMAAFIRMKDAMEFNFTKFTLKTCIYRSGSCTGYIWVLMSVI